MEVYSELIFNMIIFFSLELIQILPKFDRIASYDYGSKFSFVGLADDFNCLVEYYVHEWIISFQDTSYSSITIEM